MFFSESYRARRVKTPVELLVGAIRGCAAFRSAPILARLTEHLRRMGQQLFFAPNVAGWPSGLNWLEGRMLLARANFAADFSATTALIKPDEELNASIVQLATVLWGANPTDARLQECITDVRKKTNKLSRNEGPVSASG